MGKFPRFFREAVGTILDIRDILYFAFGIGGNMSAIAAAIANISIIYPISLCVVSSLVLIYGIVKTIISYKKWVKIRDVPILDDLMQKALSLHLHLANIQERVVEKNTKKRADTKAINKLTNKYLETIGFRNQKILVKSLNPDGTLNKYGYKRIKRLYHLKEKEYFTILPFFKDFSKLLNKNKLGLKTEMENDEKYDQLNTELIESQLRLNICEEDTHLLNDLKSLSYGLYNLSIGLRLINENRAWYKKTPESYEPFVDARDEMPETIERVYLRMSTRVKLQLKRSMLKGGVL